jgi:serine/threonine protein kinase
VSSLRLSASGEPLEVSLTRGLRQAGIMATLGYAYADAAASPAGARAPSRAAAPSRTCWMLFEYCNRGTLVDAVVRGWFRTRRCPLAGAPHLRVVALTALEVAAAMAHLHARRVMHGALCGGNVMLTASATNPHGFMARVGDFGLVRTCTGAGASAAAAGGGDAGNGSGAAAAAAAAAAPHPVDQRLAVNAYG